MFKGIKNFFKKAFSDSANDSSFSSMNGGGRDTPLAGNVSASQLINANKNWVYVCVDKIAQTISGIDLKLRKYNAKGTDVEMFDHKILDVLRKPNRLMTGRDFIYTIYGHLELCGNAYILKNTESNPSEMFPLNPGNVRAMYNDNHTDIIKYLYTVGTKTFEYPREQVVHLKYPSLTNVFKGSGTLQHIAEWVDVDSAATEFNRRFFINGASPSGLLETEATDMKGLEIAKAGFEMRYAGTVNAHQTAVLSKGAKYTSLSASPRDMQFSEMDNRYRDKILAGFGVPKSVVGIVEDVNRASAEASYFVFLLFTIDPKMKNFVEYLNEFLLPSFTGTDNLYFSYDNIVPENDDLEIRENVASLGGQSWKTINEVRAEDGLAPIENGDFVYGGFSTIPIGKPVQQQNNNLENAETKTKKAPSLRVKDAVKKDKALDNIVDAMFDSKFLEKAVELSTAELAEIAHKEFITRVSGYENKFVKAVKAFDEQIKEIVISNLKADKSYNIKSLFDTTEAQRLFVGITSPILQDLLKTEGEAQMQRLDTGMPFNPLNEAVQDKLKKLLNLTAQSYTDTTLKLLNTQLQEGISNGESLAKLTERVADVFGLTEQYRAERVARTTVFGVANNSARDAYKQSGVVKSVKWHTAEDEKVCEYCGPLDGKIIGIDDDFFQLGDVVRGSNGGTMRIDFDTIQDPPLHAQCRCFTNAEVIAVERSQIDIEIKEEADAEVEALEALIKEFEDHE